MKSIKFVAGLVAGAALLGTVSAQAAAEAVPLNISIITWSQTTTTNSAGVITYISTPHTIKSADLVAKLATILGVTVPAGSMLGLSIINSDADNTYAGDVVIMSSAGIILWDVRNFGNDTGHANLSFGFNTDVSQYNTTVAYNPRVPQPRNFLGNSISQAYSARGRGYFYFNIYAYPTEAVDAYVGSVGDFYDDVGSVTAVKGTYGSQLTTGGVNFAGGGEFENYGLDFDMIQPASLVASAAGSNLPWNIFNDIF
jgi:hypothetical protein